VTGWERMCIGRGGADWR